MEAWKKATTKGVRLRSTAGQAGRQARQAGRQAGRGAGRHEAGPGGWEAAPQLAAALDPKRERSVAGLGWSTQRRPCTAIGCPLRYAVYCTHLPPGPSPANGTAESPCPRAAAAAGGHTGGTRIQQVGWVRAGHIVAGRCSTARREPHSPRLLLTSPRPGRLHGCSPRSAHIAVQGDDVDARHVHRKVAALRHKVGLAFEVPARACGGRRDGARPAGRWALPAEMKVKVCGCMRAGGAAGTAASVGQRDCEARHGAGPIPAAAADRGRQRARGRRSGGVCKVQVVDAIVWLRHQLFSSGVLQEGGPGQALGAAGSGGARPGRARGGWGARWRRSLAPAGWPPPCLRHRVACVDGRVGGVLVGEQQLDLVIAARAHKGHAGQQRLHHARPRVPAPARQRRQGRSSRHWVQADREAYRRARQGAGEAHAGATAAAPQGFSAAATAHGW